MVTIEQVKAAVGGRFNQAQAANAKTVVDALNEHGAKFGLVSPHRLAHFLPQVMHESGNFVYDREIWGPTEAQVRYDVRADLGNTPAVDGDGKLYMGRTGIQITGKANYKAFRDWCRKSFGDVPDFVAEPGRVNEAPWEGLAPIWYWDKTKLNRYADENDIEMITRRINGGLNGYPDRLKKYDAVALVLLGYGPRDIVKFQTDNGLATDGVGGPRTRAVMHKALVDKRYAGHAPDNIRNAPVEHKVTKVVVPEGLDRPVQRTNGFWERLSQIAATLGGLGAASWLQDWRVVLAAGGVIIGVSIVGLILHKRVIDAVKTAKDALKDSD